MELWSQWFKYGTMFLKLEHFAASEVSYATQESHNIYILTCTKMYKALNLLWGSLCKSGPTFLATIVYNFDQNSKFQWQHSKVLVLVPDGTIDIMTLSPSSTTTTIPTATLAHGTPGLVSMTPWFLPHWDDCCFVVMIVTAWRGWTLVSTRGRALRAVATMVRAGGGGSIWGRGWGLDLVELQLKWSLAVRRGVGGICRLGATPTTPSGFG